MNRLRYKLALIFIGATLLPLGVTVWMSSRLLEHSLSYSTTQQLERTSDSLYSAGRALYQTSCDLLRQRARSRDLQPLQLSYNDPDLRSFADSGDSERFHLVGERRDQLRYYRRTGDQVEVYQQRIDGPGMQALAEQRADASAAVERLRSRDIRRGLLWTLVIASAGVWIVLLIAVLAIGSHITKPVEELTAGLSELANGNLGARLLPRGEGEVAAAMSAFNHTAAQLEDSREKLVHMTRLESWQTLARKMAHEVKNSLTPIRLTMEEILARKGDRDEQFLEQASQIVVDEVATLERRVRAFSHFACEPPVCLSDVDLNALVEERIAFLRKSHPKVRYELRLSEDPLPAHIDADLIKGVLTNLLENAAQAAGDHGLVLSRTWSHNGHVVFEVHDSGPGLSAHARGTLFEPTISFKKNGMGLGLSIAKNSAAMVGGDIVPVDSEIGGAGFRVVLPRAGANAHA